MTKAGKFALCFALSVAAFGASDPVFAARRSAVGAGEGEVRQLLLLMDRDQNGHVSRAEFMGFMAAEFNRLDVDRSGALTPRELSRTILRVQSFHTSPHK